MAQNASTGPIGLPLDRVDGPLKVTGRATYAYEYAPQGRAAYGFIVSAAIGKGRVVGVNVREAERAPPLRWFVSATPWSSGSTIFTRLRHMPKFPPKRMAAARRTAPTETSTPRSRLRR